MKKSLHVMMFIPLAMASALFAEPPSSNPGKAPTGKPAGGERRGEARHGEPRGEERGHAAGRALALHRLLSMEDEQLDRMVEVIQKVKALPKAERAALLKRMEAQRDASPEERAAFGKELREKFGMPEGAPPEKGGGGGHGKGGQGPGREGAERPVRNLLEKHFSSLPPEQAKAEKEKFLALPREGKVEYLRKLRAEHGLPELPPAPRAPDAPRGEVGPGADL